MRRILLFLMLTLLVVSLVACVESNSNLKINTISEAKLTEREEFILSSTTDQSFVFDFNVEDKYKDVTVWVEKYESGKLVGEVNRISTQVKSMGAIIFTTSKTTEESNQGYFTISINSDGSTGTGWGPDTITKDDDLAILWGSNPLLGNISTMDKMVLASICYSRGKDEVRTLTTDFYSDMDSHMNELKNYDVVYLLRSDFK